MSKPTISQMTFRSTDRIFDVLRLSNVKEFGDVPSTQFLFRGLSKSSYELLPKVWRPDFPSSYVDRKRFRSAAISVAANLSENSAAHALCRANSHRFIDAMERAITEHELVHRFEKLAVDAGLLGKSHFSTVFEELMPDPVGVFAGQTSNHHPLAQHHGVPTSLLDWTLDPLTALAFAIDGIDLMSVKFPYSLAIWRFNYAEYKQTTSTFHPYDFDPPPELYLQSDDVIENQYLHHQRGRLTGFKRANAHFVRTGKYPTVDEIVPAEFLRKYLITLTSEAQLADVAMRLMRERKTLVHRMPTFDNCARLTLLTAAAGLDL